MPRWQEGSWGVPNRGISVHCVPRWLEAGESRLEHFRDYWFRSRLCVGQDFRRAVGSVRVEGQLAIVSLMARAIPGQSVSEVSRTCTGTSHPPSSSRSGRHELFKPLLNLLFDSPIATRMCNVVGLSTWHDTARSVSSLMCGHQEPSEPSPRGVPLRYRWPPRGVHCQTRCTRGSTFQCR